MQWNDAASDGSEAEELSADDPKTNLQRDPQKKIMRETHRHTEIKAEILNLILEERVRPD